MSLLHKPICLVLNKSWQPTRVSILKDILGNISDYREVEVIDGNGLSTWQTRWKLMGFDITYPKFSNGQIDYDSDPEAIEVVTWDKWCTLPIREEDDFIRTPNMRIRVPRVVMASDYEEMPEKSPRNDLSYLYELYDGICQYSKKKIPRHRATKDHVIPKNRGGSNELSNIVLADIDINNKKGDQLNSECGLIDPIPIVPGRRRAEELIKPREDNPVWNFFLKKRKKK